jgi:hypothetical protein
MYAMIKPGHLLLLLFIIGATANKIRVLVSEIENCAKDAYIDPNGKIREDNCDGCKKVCVKCNDGYYQNEMKRCRKLPNNCLEAESNGDCTKCEEGYVINKNKKCRKGSENCNEINKDGICTKCK